MSARDKAQVVSSIKPANARQENSVSSPQSSRAVPKGNNILEELISEVKMHNPLVAGLLRSCSAEGVKNGKLNIVASSKFHKGKLQEQKAIRILEESANKVFGENIKIQILGGDK